MNVTRKNLMAGLAGLFARLIGRIQRSHNPRIECLEGVDELGRFLAQCLNVTTNEAANLRHHVGGCDAVDARESGCEVSQSQFQHVAYPPIDDERRFECGPVQLFDLFEGWKRKHRVTSLMEIADFLSLAQTPAAAESEASA